VTAHGEILLSATGELAAGLRAEIGRLEVDARLLQERLPMFAANVRTLRARLAGVLGLCESLLAQRDAGAPISEGRPS
jgi:hypothetical protein